MNHSNGRLILKVKKRRSSIPLPSKHISNEKENKCYTPQQKSLKRANPFSKDNEEPTEKIKNNKFEIKQDIQKNMFLSSLSNSQPQLTKNSDKTESSYEVALENSAENTSEIKDSYIYSSSELPLDWTIKQRVRYFSKNPFKCDLKSSNECNGIHQFTRNLEEKPQLCQYLYNWIHPSIPGLPNYPLKTTSLGNTTKEEKNSINMLANNKDLRDIVMKQWKVSFQSLFSMLKTSNCPYFYLCCHQFSVLFKAAGVGGKQLTAIMGPTTKGLRELLTEEGLTFEFLHKSTFQTSKEVEFGFEEEDNQQNNKTPSLNNSCDEDFFDSIGLNKKEHFPQMEQQERISLRSKLNLIDKKPASVVKIKNCNGLFNFLLNATFLCASSGASTGVPPTLIAPNAFEGASLTKCKINSGPVKQQRKTTLQTMYTIDVNGFILPGQLYKLSKMLANDCEREPLTVHLKTFESLQCFSGDGDDEIENNDISNNKFSLITEDLSSYLNQTPVIISDSKEITYQDGLFCF